MRKIDLFIFDLDGTLIDSTADIAAAVNHTLGRLGEPELGPEVIRENVGDGVLQLLKRCLLEKHRDRVEEAVSLFRSYYGAHLVEKTSLYPGVREILRHFRGKANAVLTNKPERFVGPILEGLGVHDLIDAWIGGDGKSVPKPAAEPVHALRRRFRVEGARAVMVGDSAVDMETGKLGGILTCAVTYGYRPREELEAAGPDYLIHDIGELREIFC